MNNSLYALTILLLLLACHDGEKDNSDGAGNLTEIDIQLKGFDPATHKRFIDVTIENGLNPIEQQLRISDSGRISYNFINSRKTELVFDYEGKQFSLIASPNEEIGGHLSIRDLINWSGFVDFRITGENQNTNELIIANTVYLDSLIRTASSFAAGNRSKPDLEYKVQRIAQMHDQLSAFGGFVGKNNIDNALFIDWATSKIRCAAGIDLSVYPFFGRINRNSHIEDEYFSFLKDLKADVNHEVVYQDYLAYLKEVAMSLLIMSNICERFDRERELLRRDSISNFPILFGLMKGLPDDGERELIMAFAFAKARRIPDNYYDSLKSFASHSLVEQLGEKEEVERRPITALLEEYDIPQDEKAELLQLYKETRNKVVFHDFWFASCAPCARELPNYNDLMTSVGPDVVFIFYGVYMDEREWKAGIAKFGLKGKHYLLTKNQIAFFEKYFQVRGFPHHQIINTNGQIVKEQIPAVNPHNFERIKSLIIKNNI